MFLPSFLIAAVFILVLPFQSVTQATNCGCAEQLKALDENLRAGPAYQDLSREGLAEYAQVMDSLTGLAVAEPSVYECFLLLQQALLQVNDNHNQLFGVRDSSMEAFLDNPEALETYRQTESYRNIPQVDEDLEQLERRLEQAPPESIEGIYRHPRGIMTVGLYKDHETGFYRGVILKSKAPLWVRGDLIFTMIPYGNGYFRNVTGDFRTKRLQAYGERIAGGRFLNYPLVKTGGLINHGASIYPNSTYLRKELSDEITYLKVGSFKAFFPTLSEADNFYAELNGKLKKPYLIVDLRGNSGGGVRNSGALFKLLRDYVKRNQLFLLVNHRTTSNAEQFTTKLMRFNNCTILGDRTNGTLAYELEGNSILLPCEQFLAVLSSKRHKAFLEWEAKGIEPDVLLKYDEPWVEQVVAYIQDKK